MRDPEIKAEALWDTDKERWHIRISHHIYGNTHHSYLEPEFLRSRDYAVLTECSEALKGVIGEGARVVRGEKTQQVKNFGDAVRWLLDQAEAGVRKPVSYTHLIGGRDKKTNKERKIYLKDDAEMARYLLNIALKDAILYKSEADFESGIGLRGTELENLIKEFEASKSVIERLSQVIDRAALLSISSGVSIDLSDEEKAAASAAALQSDMRGQMCISDSFNLFHNILRLRDHAARAARKADGTGAFNGEADIVHHLAHGHFGHKELFCSPGRLFQRLVREGPQVDRTDQPLSLIHI